MFFSILSSNVSNNRFEQYGYHTANTVKQTLCGIKNKSLSFFHAYQPAVCQITTSFISYTDQRIFSPVKQKINCLMQKIYQFIYQKYPFTVYCFYRYGCMPLKKYIVCPAGNLMKNVAYFAKGFFLAVISSPSNNKQKEMQFSFEFPENCEYQPYCPHLSSTF